MYSHNWVEEKYFRTVMDWFELARSGQPLPAPVPGMLVPVVDYGKPAGAPGAPGGRGRGETVDRSWSPRKDLAENWFASSSTGDGGGGGHGSGDGGVREKSSLGPLLQAQIHVSAHKVGGMIRENDPEK